MTEACCVGGACCDGGLVVTGACCDGGTSVGKKGVWET